MVNSAQDHLCSQEFIKLDLQC